MSKTFAVIIQTPDYEQTLYVNEPDTSTEESVRDKYSQRFTVYEVWEVTDEDEVEND